MHQFTQIERKGYIYGQARDQTQDLMFPMVTEASALTTRLLRTHLLEQLAIDF
jgi:hypothetical protein